MSYFSGYLRVQDGGVFGFAVISGAESRSQSREPLFGVDDIQKMFQKLKLFRSDTPETLLRGFVNLIHYLLYLHFKSEPE